MFRISVTIVALSVSLLVAGCSRPQHAHSEERLAKHAPQSLLVQEEISGTQREIRLSQPFGVAPDSRHSIYLCDAGNDRVLRFNNDMVAEAETGGFGSTEGLLDRPSFVTVDNSLNVLVSDAGNRRVCRFNSRLNYVDDISFSDQENPLEFGVPSGTALTDYGTIWVADREKNRIAVFDIVGNFDRFIGDFGYGGGQLQNPEKIVTSERGDRFIVCDAGNRRLVIYDGYGNFKREIKVWDLDYPIAASIDQENFIWVLDRTSGILEYLSPRGAKLFEIGPNLPGSEKPLQNPSDVAVLSDGWLLISDTGNNRLVLCQVIYPE